MAYRIWAYCQPREWNVTIADIAEALDEKPQAVRAIIVHRGWMHRIRYMTPSGADNPHSRGGISTYLDGGLDSLNRWA